MPSKAKTITVDDLKEAYISAYYEGAGDDTWYWDHNTKGDLDKKSHCYRKMIEFLKSMGFEDDN